MYLFYASKPAVMTAPADKRSTYFPFSVKALYNESLPIMHRYKDMFLEVDVVGTGVDPAS